MRFIASKRALRPANLSDARYVGSQPNLEIRWAISEHFLAALNARAALQGLSCSSLLRRKKLVLRQYWSYVSVFDDTGRLWARIGFPNEVLVVPHKI